MASLAARLSDLISVIGYDMKAVQDQLGNGAIVLDPWHKVDTAGEPIFKNSWTNNVAGANVAQFRKDPFGVVKLSGYVKGGASGSTIFTLPAGYRPVDQVAFSCYASAGNCLVTVDANGDVKVTQVSGPVTTLTSLDDVEFDTEAVSQIAALMGPKGLKGDKGDPGDSVTVPMDTWHQVGAAGEPAFGTNWSHYDGGTTFGIAGFRKDPLGRVKLKGQVKSSTAITAGSTIFTLPAGYRPPKAMRFGGVESTLTAPTVTWQQCNIYPDGTVVAYADSPTIFSLDGIEFDTETVTQFAVGPKGDPGASGAQGVPGSSVQVPLDIWHRVGTAGEPAFLNSWVNFDATRGARFRKYPDGKVRIQGIIKTGASATAAFTLPAGYRPTVVETFPVIAAASTAFVTIDASGNVIPTNVAGNVATNVYLDGIEFDTELVTQFAVGPQGPQGAKGDPGDSVTVPMDSWHLVGAAGQPAFQGTWVSYGADRAPRFRKYPDGKVKLAGAVKSGVNGTVVFTLPVGYRPASVLSYVTYFSGGTGQVTILTDGTVTLANLTGTGATQAALDEIEFDTETVTQFAVGPKGEPGPALVNVTAHNFLPSYDVSEALIGYGDETTTGRPDLDYYIFTSVEVVDPENSSPSGLMYVQTCVGIYSPEKVWRRYRVGAYTSNWVRLSDLAIRVTLNKNTVINLANGTETSVAFNVDVEDDWGFHAGSDIWAIVPAGMGGMYDVSFECWYGSNAVNARYTRLYRDRGGVVNNFASDIRQGSPGGVATIVHLNEPIDLQPGDKVWPSLYQNAGTGVTLVTPASTCQLKLVRIGNV